MKKIGSILLILVIAVCGAFAGCVIADGTTQDFTLTMQIGNPIMTVDGIEKEIDPGMGTTPIILNDRTLIPVRAVVEEIGGTVGWNGETQEVTLTYGQDTILLTIDNTTAYLNGAAQTLDIAPTVINDRTMLPIRFIAESFGYDVDWSGETQTVTIIKATAEGLEPTADAAQPPSANPTEEPIDMPNDNVVKENKMLVVYFSGTGNTKLLAETIAETTGADIFEIVPEVPYTSEDLNYNNSNCRANQEMNDENARPVISSSIENIEDYDTIFIGYPIWWGTMPRIINTFLDTYDLSGKTIMPFCTSGGSGISTSVSAIRSVCGSADVKDGLRGTSSTGSTQIREWIDRNIDD